MKSDKKILLAFILNLSFSLFEFLGGFLTGSVAIASDALHDLGDAISIGLAWILEKKSKKQPDALYSFGYARYSVLGSVITMGILLTGSVFVIVNAVGRFFHPVSIDYNGMLLFAAVGATVNLCAARFTGGGKSLNQRAVNLHMLEDALGWLAVLAGALIMYFTDFWFLDPVISIVVACFILINAAKGLKQVLDLFLMKVPADFSTEDIRARLLAVEGICDAHHIHIWSTDGIHNYATVHIVSAMEPVQAKEAVKNTFSSLGITHTTVELETPGEACSSICCHVEPLQAGLHHHHHHGHCGHHHR